MKILVRSVRHLAGLCGHNIFIPFVYKTLHLIRGCILFLSVLSVVLRTGRTGVLHTLLTRFDRLKITPHILIAGMQYIRSLYNASLYRTIFKTINRIPYCKFYFIYTTHNNT